MPANTYPTTYAPIQIQEIKPMPLVYPFKFKLSHEWELHGQGMKAIPIQCEKTRCMVCK